MNYKIMRTQQGPVVVTEDEVLFMHQILALDDYASFDPEFVDNIKVFLEEVIRDLAEKLIGTMHGLTDDFELGSFHHYFGAVSALNAFEQRVAQRRQAQSPDAGFPGNITLTNSGVPELPIPKE